VTLFRAVFTVFLAGAGLPAQSLKQDDASAVRAVLDAQVAAWNRGDYVAFMDGYEKSPDLTFSGSNGVTRGWESVLDRYRQHYSTREAMGTLSFSELEMHSIAPGAALVLGKFQLVRDQKAGGNASGHFSLVFRKTPAGWRIIHDHTS
jgi:uncharacterized protein (TIGR02246 family)